MSDAGRTTLAAIVLGGSLMLVGAVTMLLGSDAGAWIAFSEFVLSIGAFVRTIWFSG